MTKEIMVLAGTAASIGFLHTLFGPDHYLPFIMMARARRWSSVKTILITVLCGIGHVGSSVVLGAAGVILGFSLNKLISFEAFRGNFAAWLIIGFGFIYFIWGVLRALRNKPHSHWHIHQDGNKHQHDHFHVENHTHTHNKKISATITPWVLFTIFVLGPCEPLIPILMYPASENSIFGLVFVTLIFCLVTILTMVAVVIAMLSGINLIPFGKFERYMHAAAGLMICLSGLAIVFIGL